MFAYCFSTYFLGENDIEKNTYNISIKIRDEFLNNVPSISHEIQTKTENYFYYHLENSKNYLDSYYVLKVEQKNILELPIENIKKGTIIRFHYQGCTKEIKI